MPLGGQIMQNGRSKKVQIPKYPHLKWLLQVEINQKRDRNASAALVSAKRPSSLSANRPFSWSLATGLLGPNLVFFYLAQQSFAADRVGPPCRRARQYSDIQWKWGHYGWRDCDWLCFFCGGGQSSLLEARPFQRSSSKTFWRDLTPPAFLSRVATYAIQS